MQHQIQQERVQPAAEGIHQPVGPAARMEQRVEEQLVLAALAVAVERREVRAEVGCAQPRLARIGGDEYVLLTHASTKADIDNMAQRILDRVQEPVNVEGEQAHVTASIGIARFPDDGDDLESLLKAADAAMYQVKKGGKNGYERSV